MLVWLTRFEEKGGRWQRGRGTQAGQTEEEARKRRLLCAMPLSVQIVSTASLILWISQVIHLLATVVLLTRRRKRPVDILLPYASLKFGSHMDTPGG